MTDTPPDTRTVTVERAIPFPPDRIWRALTQPHLMAEWLMKNDFAPEIGHRFKLTGEWGGVLDCEVLAIEPNRTLAYSWNFASDDPAYALNSTVTFTLTPTATGTVLTVEQKGFRPDQKQAFHGARAGWTEMLGKLEDLVGRPD